MRFSREDLSSEDSFERPSLMKKLTNERYNSPFIQITFDKDGRDQRIFEKQRHGNQLIPRNVVDNLSSKFSKPLDTVASRIKRQEFQRLIQTDSMNLKNMNAQEMNGKFLDPGDSVMTRNGVKLQPLVTDRSSIFKNGASQMMRQNISMDTARASRVNPLKVPKEHLPHFNIMYETNKTPKPVTKKKYPLQDAHLMEQNAFQMVVEKGFEMQQYTEDLSALSALSPTRKKTLI